MIAAVRSTALAALLAAVALAGAACTPTSGPLGTPASPAVTPVASDEPSPSDVAPESPSAEPAETPSATPSTAPTEVPSSSAAASASPTAVATPKPTATPAGTMLVRAYFVLGSFTGNEGLVPVLRETRETKAVASMAMQALLAGPKGAELEGSPAMYTAIPDGTRLLGIAIKNGVATVDLSGQFATGGGTYSMTARLAQVVFTLTQVSTVDSVRFKLDGVPVTTFSSEGIVLDVPVDPPDYRGLLPALFLVRPAWGAAAGNPAVIGGLANVFEATFRVQVRDAKGGILADEQVMATCGTGCWGTFKQSVEYRVTKAQYGTLRVYEPSAKDGSPINVTEYRVWLTP